MDNFADTLKCGHPVDKYLIGFDYELRDLIVYVVGSYIIPHLCAHKIVYTLLTRWSLAYISIDLYKP